MRRALLLVALVATGCGSSQHLSDAAKYAPADAQAFVVVRAGDPHWRDFARLVLGRVPRAQAAAFALVHGKIVAVSTQGTPPAHALADDARFRAALRAAARGLHGLGYVRGDVMSQRLHAIPGAISVAVGTTAHRFHARTNGRQPSLATLQFRWGVASLTAGGMELRAASAGLPVAETQSARGVEQLAMPYAPGLLDEIPADSRFVVDVSLPPGAFENLARLPAPVAAAFPGPESAIAADLDDVFQGETAVYRRPGGETTLVTQPADLFAALRAVAALPPLRRLHRTFLGGQLVLSTSVRGIADFRGGGAKLASRVRLPGPVTGFLYLANRLTGWGETIGGDPVFEVRFVGGSG